MSARSIIAFVLCCASLTGQQVWKVCSSMGYGAQFSDLPPAVAAAAPGDTIWVYTVFPLQGFGNLYTSPTIDKPLTIVGFDVGLQPGTNAPGTIGLVGPLTITNIPAGSRVVLTNVVMNVTGVIDSVLVSDCAGTVVIENLYSPFWQPDRTLRIVDCADVTLRGSELQLGSLPIDIINSHVLISNSWIDYVPALPPPLGITSTRESIFLQDSSLTVAGSVVLGRPAILTYQPPRNAVVLDNSTLRISPTSLVQGGILPGFPGTQPTDYMPACVFTGPGTSEVLHDPRCVATNYGSVQPTVTWQHEMIHDWVVADELFHCQVTGPPTGFALLAIGEYSPWSQVSTPGAPIGGQLALDPFTACAVAIAYVPSSHEWTFHCPALADTSTLFALQALTLSPSGEFGWTIPSPLTVAWDKDRIP